VRDNFKPVAVGVNAPPLTFILSPSARGEAIRPPGRRLQHVLIAFWLRHTNYRYVAPHQEDFLFSCLESLAVASHPLQPDSLGVRSHVRYCTVTSVPTGISEKNLRAVSSGNRMQPCDAG
jgi:hypothetical protein